jgi:hypothetical protein
MVEGEGFEPSKAEPSDLQSDPFDRSGTPPNEADDYAYVFSFCQRGPGSAESAGCCAAKTGAKSARRVTGIFSNDYMVIYRLTVDSVALSLRTLTYLDPLPKDARKRPGSCSHQLPNDRWVESRPVRGDSRRLTSDATSLRLYFPTTRLDAKQADRPCCKPDGAHSPRDAGDRRATHKPARPKRRRAS